MKVLHLITGLNVGGAENMLAKLIENDPSPQSQHVLSLLEPGPLANRIESAGANVATLGMKRGLPTLPAALRLARYVRSLEPDILHGWMYHGNLAASFASSLSRKPTPVIWNVRHSLGDEKKETARTRALLALSRRLSHRPRAIVYNSFASASQHETYGFSSNRRIVIPNGFDCSLFQPDEAARLRLEKAFDIPAGKQIVGCVARLHPMKGHKTLVSAAITAHERGEPFHLLLVGHGLNDPPGDLGELLAKLPPEHVTTSEARLDVADWLPGLDVLAVPSGWGEAFPNIIGEALASGVPVVTTDVGDSRIIVGSAGETVAPDNPLAMADAIARILQLAPEERAALTREGRDRIVQKYSLDAITDRYRNLYHELASSNAGVARIRASGEPRIEESNSVS